MCGQAHVSMDPPMHPLFLQPVIAVEHQARRPGQGGSAHSFGKPAFDELRTGRRDVAQRAEPAAAAALHGGAQ